MKLLFFVILLLLPQCSLAERNLFDLLKIHCNWIQKERFDSWMLVSDKQIHKFPINWEKDTIYITSWYANGGGEGTFIWNNKQNLNIYPDTIFTIHEYGTPPYHRHIVAYNLYSNWDVDVLKHLGREYYAEGKVTPTYHSYLTRIIIENGNVRVDTATYLSPDLDEIRTQKQLDSIREIVHLINNTNLIKTSYLKENNKTDNDNSNTQSPQHKSIWQRIIEWFCNLWKSIFG